MNEISVVGIPRGEVTLVTCSVCGPVAEVPKHLAVLRLLAHS